MGRTSLSRAAADTQHYPMDESQPIRRALPAPQPFSRRGFLHGSVLTASGVAAAALVARAARGGAAWTSVPGASSGTVHALIVE